MKKQETGARIPLPRSGTISQETSDGELQWQAARPIPPKANGPATLAGTVLYLPVPASCTVCVSAASLIFNVALRAPVVAALGMVACHYDYDWPTAEREYKKAFELNPNYASAHQYYALGLMAHGRFAEANAQLEIARRLDPLALIVDVDLALLRKFQRDFDGVIAVSKSILERDPTYHLGYSMLTTGYLLERRWDDWRAADAKHPQGEFLRAMANGHPDEIERAFRKLTDEAKAGARRPYDVGHYGMLKGDRSLALDWLEKSYQHHDYWMLFINVDPEYDAIRSEPRFQAIIHRLGVG